MTKYIEQEYIRENTMEKRSYPVSLAPQAVKENCIVVLPAGLGKTAIVLWVMAEYLSHNNGSILFLAPTRMLVNQHYDFLRNCMTLEWTP